MTPGRDGARAPRRLWSSRAAIGAVAVAWLASGCTTGSSTNSATSGASKGTMVGGAPDQLSAGPGAGWDCPGGQCLWTEEGAIEKAPRGPATAPPSPPTSSGRDGVTTTTRSGGSAEAPKVIAAMAPSPASVDDNAAFPAYLRYRKDAEGLGVRFLPIDVERRRVISVLDVAGRPVLGANVAVTDAAGAVVGLVKTYADGRALFVAPTAAQATYGVSATKAGVTATGSLRPGDDGAVITLDVPRVPVDLDVLFVLDGTGSMDDEIKQLQTGVGPMVSRLQQLAGGGSVRLGVTVYRDRDDLFVTRTFDLTPDVVAFGQAVNEVQVGGGGDTPEDVEAALHDALTKPSWRFGETVKLLFLVGDAPPHLDYGDATTYRESLTNATQQGVKIMAVGASGLDDQGEYVFRQLAQGSMGRFVNRTSGATGTRPVSGRSHALIADEVSNLPLDELVLRLTADEMASHG